VRFRLVPVRVFFQRHTTCILVSVGVHRHRKPQKHNQAVEQSCVVSPHRSSSRLAIAILAASSAASRAACPRSNGQHGE
jgi:hypothetical protein